MVPAGVVGGFAGGERGVQQFVEKGEVEIAEQGGACSCLAVLSFNNLGLVATIVHGQSQQLARRLWSAVLLMLLLMPMRRPQAVFAAGVCADRGRPRHWWRAFSHERRGSEQTRTFMRLNSLRLTRLESLAFSTCFRTLACELRQHA